MGSRNVLRKALCVLVKMLFYNANVNSTPTLILRVQTYFHCATETESNRRSSLDKRELVFAYLFKPPLLLSLTGHAEFHLHTEILEILPK